MLQRAGSLGRGQIPGGYVSLDPGPAHGDPSTSEATGAPRLPNPRRVSTTEQRSASTGFSRTAKAVQQVRVCTQDGFWDVMAVTAAGHDGQTRSRLGRAADHVCGVPAHWQLLQKCCKIVGRGSHYDLPVMRELWLQSPRLRLCARRSPERTRNHAPGPPCMHRPTDAPICPAPTRVPSQAPQAIRQRDKFVPLPDDRMLDPMELREREGDEAAAAAEVAPQYLAEEPAVALEHANSKGRITVGVAGQGGGG